MTYHGCITLTTCVFSEYNIQLLDICSTLSILPSSSSIFSSNTLSCSVLQGRLTVYVDNALMSDKSGLESLFNLTRALIKDGMNSGELALATNAVVVLRYKDDSETLAVPTRAVIAPVNSSTRIIQWSLIGLAIIAVLLALLATRKYLQRRKEHAKIFYNLDEYASSNHSYPYEFGVFSDSQQRKGDAHVNFDDHVSNDFPPYDFGVFSDSQVSSGNKFQSSEQTNVSIQPRLEREVHAFKIESFDEFLVDRFPLNDELYLADMTPSYSQEKAKIELVTPYRNAIRKGRESIHHVHLGSINGQSFTYANELDLNLTNEALESNRGTAPRCSLCFMKADGWMKCCQCGNASCTEIAHATCIHKRNSTLWKSYPGKPPPMLPVILCGSTSKSLRQSKVEPRMTSAVSKSLTLEDLACAHDDKMFIGCL